MDEYILHAGTVEDDLTLDDYRDILTELRTSYSLQGMVNLIGSRFTKAWWSKIERGQAPFSREVRRELRAMYKISKLRLTAQEAVEAVREDAAVLQIGAEDAAEVNRIVMVGGPDGVVIQKIGAGSPMRFDADGRVTPVTWPQERTEDTTASDSTLGAVEAPQRPNSPQRKARPFMARPVANREQEDRRLELAVSWSKVIEAGLAALEMEERRHALTEMLEAGAGGWRTIAERASLPRS